MSTTLITKDSHPRKGFTSITQLGLKAMNLAVMYKTEIDDRLPGVAEGLVKDLDSLGVVVPGAVQTRNESMAATSEQNARTRQGHARVWAIRTMVRLAGAPKEVQHAYGVGRKVSATQVKDVVAALHQIVDRATLAPEEAAELGLGPAVVAELKTYIESLTESGMAQEKKRASAPLSTKERNLTANRILQTVALIAGTGMLAFADDPITFASFEALLVSSKKAQVKKGAKPAKEPGKESAKEAAKEPAKEAVKEAAKEPVKEAAKEAAKEPVKESAEKGVEPAPASIPA